MYKLNVYIILLMWVLNSWSMKAQTVYFSENFNTGTDGFPPTGWLIGDGGSLQNNGFPTTPDVTWVVQTNYNGNDLGDSKFLFIKFNANGTQNDTITTPNIDLSSITSGVIQLSFVTYYGDYYYTYSDTGFIEVYDGTNWVNLDTYTGASVGGWGTSAETKVYDISNYALGNANFKVRFIYVGDNAWHWAIDQVKVFTPPPDLKMTTTYFERGLVSCSNINDTVIAEVKNVGSGDATNFSLSYEVYDASMNVIATGTDNITGPLAPGATLTHKFSSGVSLSPGNGYTIKTFLSWASDQVKSNDTIIGGPYTYATASIFSPNNTTPWLETFDTFGRNGTANGSNDTLKNGWLRFPAKNEPYTWKVGVSGQSYSANTGPINDHTTGQGKYVYTEASTSQVGEIAILYSPCIDLNNIANPYLSWWFHLYGQDIDSLTVDISIDNGKTWTNLKYYNGAVQTSETAPWKSDTVNLYQYKGKLVRLRFVGVRGLGFAGDMAIDDVSIFNMQADAKLDTLINLPDSICSGTTITFNALITNISSMGNYTGKVIFNIGSTNDTIAIGDVVTPSDTDTVAYTYTFTGSGNVPVEVVLLPYGGDPNTSNDTIRDTIYVIPLPSFTLTDVDSVVFDSVVCFGTGFSGADSTSWSGSNNVQINTTYGSGDSAACVKLTGITTFPDTQYICAEVYKNGCSRMKCDTFIVKSKPSYIANSVMETIVVYPNPVKDVVNIRIYGSANIYLYDVKGNMVTSDVIFNSGKIDLSNLSKGIYILQVRIGDATRNYKIIKE